MTGIAEHSCTWLEMAGKCLKWVEWITLLEMSGNDWKYMEMAGKDWKQRELPDMDMNVWKWLEIV